MEKGQVLLSQCSFKKVNYLVCYVCCTHCYTQGSPEDTPWPLPHHLWLTLPPDTWWSHNHWRAQPKGKANGMASESLGAHFHLPQDLFMVWPIQVGGFWICSWLLWLKISRSLMVCSPWESQRDSQNSKPSLIKQKPHQSEDNTFVHIYEKSTTIK